MLIVGLILAQTVICAIFSYYGFDFTSTDKCRDEVLSEVPIYPNAALIKEDDARSYPEAGTLTRVYQTADSLDAVKSFYGGVTSCIDEGETGLVCSGRPENNNRIYYEVTFAVSVDTYSMYIGWSCRESG